MAVTGFRWSALGLVLVSHLVSAQQPQVQAPLVVHEWGTLTTVHMPDGTPVGNLNRIDAADVLPGFVHRYEPVQTRTDPKGTFGKTPQTPGRPDVTMRLETPVIYIYGGNDGAATGAFDVHVQLRGGVLNEFYPKAEATVTRDEGRLATKQAAGILRPTDRINLDNYVLGTLRWSVTLDPAAKVPQTNATVWTAPRNVGASRVRAGEEGEHYLFYRGVAHLDALVSTTHSPKVVRVSGPPNLNWLNTERVRIPRIWLVDVKPNGTLAFETRAGLVIAKNAPSQLLAEIGRFAVSAYGLPRAAALRQSMKAELVAAGLLDDEAEAMLATWNESYFRKPGTRLFYMVPRAWIDYFLPLELSVPHEATRVLVGRVDLVE